MSVNRVEPPSVALGEGGPEAARISGAFFIDLYAR